VRPRLRAEAWLSWWEALTRKPRSPSGGVADLAAELKLMAGPPPPEVLFFPPDFPGLAHWPVLARVVARRWPEANRWHTQRKIAGVSGLRRRPPSARESRLVAEVERELGRRVPPFDLEFTLLPVRDREIRQLAATRYLVPETVYGGSDWIEWLRALVLRIAG
jgi:hypothetical protein